MKSDLKKQALLKLLSIQKQNSKTPIGLGFETILQSMKIDRKYLDFICGELYENKEIGYFDNGINPKGLHATSLGVSSYSLEKYKKRYKQENKENIKYYVQVFIPAASLIIAILSISQSIYQTKLNKTKSTQIEALNKKLEQVHTAIDYLEEKTKNSDSDSLKNY